ncbi:MAG: hypothetical protein ACE361_15980 [Aureliella sp.]
MVFAALDFFDYIMIAILIALFAGGTSFASGRSGSTAALGERLMRVEEKLNLLLAERRISYTPKNKERWQQLAELKDRDNAVQEYSTQYSVSQEDAEAVIAQYIADLNDYE